VTSAALPIVFDRRAATQIEEVAHWWAVNRPAAPGAVRDDLEQAFALIATQPECGVPVQNARLAGVRRIHLARLNYFVYYRLSRRLRRVEILAFWHAKRGSGPPMT